MRVGKGISDRIRRVGRCSAASRTCSCSASAHLTIFLLLVSFSIFVRNPRSRRGNSMRKSLTLRLGRDLPKHEWTRQDGEDRGWMSLSWGSRSCPWWRRRTSWASANIIHVKFSLSFSRFISLLQSLYLSLSFMLAFSISPSITIFCRSFSRFFSLSMTFFFSHALSFPLSLPHPLPLFFRNEK